MKIAVSDNAAQSSGGTKPRHVGGLSWQDKGEIHFSIAAVSVIDSSL